MKKILLITAIITCLLSFKMTTKATQAGELNFYDLTTMNFHERSNELDFNSIKKICTYDYCTYREGESMKEALEIFTDRYLSTIEDEEIRSTLKIKGITITKIILWNKAN